MNESHSSTVLESTRSPKEGAKIRANDLSSGVPSKRAKLAESVDDEAATMSILAKKMEERSKRPTVDVFDLASDVELDKEPDRRAARRAGFDPYEMMDMEKQYFPEYVLYSVDYITTRNFILMKWKEKPDVFLTWDTISRGIVVR